MKRIFFFWLLIIGLAFSTAAARPVHILSYEEMTTQADLIVIATPVATRDTGEKTTFPGIQTIFPSVQTGTAGYSGPVSGISLETTFSLLAILKGNLKENTFILYHFRLANEATGAISNGPNLVIFDLTKKTRYLMFLKKDKDGRYLALTGQTDPAFAIKELGNYPP
jgi:hypothetical protein